MEHELYNKTDKQLLKSNKVDLVAYIRTLEGTINEWEVFKAEDGSIPDTECNAMQCTECNAMQCTECTDPTAPQHLTSYTFSDTVTKKDMYSF